MKIKGVEVKGIKKLSVNIIECQSVKESSLIYGLII